MKEESVGLIPVVENEQVVGLVTDRDLVVRGIAENILDLIRLQM